MFSTCEWILILFVKCCLKLIAFFLIVYHDDVFYACFDFLKKILFVTFPGENFQRESILLPDRFILLCIFFCDAIIK